MIHKTIKPDLDLVLARFAIFGVLAILFVASSVNGHPSWLTWVVMLWGVFSIFEAAIKADEDALAANGLAKIIISHSGKLASERDEYKFVAESLDDLYVLECKKTNDLKKSIQGNQGRIAELERLNRVKAQAIIDLHQEITELKASHHGEVIGHEVHFKKIKKERDELQTLYIQQGINMLKLQKRVEGLERKLQIKTRHCEFYEQSRKGHRSLAIHRKKQINSALEQIEKLYSKAEYDYEKDRNPYYDGMLSALDLAEQAIRGELEEQALKGEG